MSQSNLALREFADRHRRVATLEHYARAAEDWDFEGWQRQRAAEKTLPLDPVFDLPEVD